MKVEINIDVLCEICWGAGHTEIIPATHEDPEDYVACANCRGDGYVIETHEITLSNKPCNDTATVVEL